MASRVHGPGEDELLGGMGMLLHLVEFLPLALLCLLLTGVAGLVGLVSKGAEAALGLHRRAGTAATRRR